MCLATGRQSPNHYVQPTHSFRGGRSPVSEPLFLIVASRREAEAAAPRPEEGGTSARLEGERTSIGRKRLGEKEEDSERPCERERNTKKGRGRRAAIRRLHRRSRWSELCWWPALALTHSIAHSILGREASQTTSDPASPATWKEAGDRPTEKRELDRRYSSALAHPIGILSIHGLIDPVNGRDIGVILFQAK